VFLTAEFHPLPLLLGLASAGAQAAAIVGSLGGGWLVDKLGRRVIFLGTMVMFIVLALAQAFAPNVETLAGIRLVAASHNLPSKPAPRKNRCHPPELLGHRWC
jgi:MFS family permease